MEGDPRLLRDALDRLLDNAIKFSRPAGGRVTVLAREEEARLCIAVEDEGVGIPAAELARVPDLFYQVDRRVLEQQGVGTGLSVAQAIALMHGGCLAATSREGAGSTFTLRLPLAAGSDSAPAGS